MFSTKYIEQRIRDSLSEIQHPSTFTYGVEISRAGIEGHANIPLNNKEDFDTFKKLCEDTTNMISSRWRVLLIPTRTNLASLPSDLFSPLLIHLIFKSTEAVENGKFFQVINGIFYFALDMTTLPLRLITLIPRAIYNHIKSVEHPLIPYLKGKGIPEALQKGVLNIVLITDINTKWTRKIPNVGNRETITYHHETITYHREVEDHEIPSLESSPPVVKVHYGEK